MNKMTTRIVISLLTITTFVSIAMAWTVSVRTAIPGSTENAVLVERVEAYLAARIRSEAAGFRVEAVRDYLAGDALADAEAYTATNPAGVVGLEAKEPLTVAVIIRGGTTALVQASGTLHDSFGDRAFAEQYLVRGVRVDGETSWVIDTVFRLMTSGD